MEYWNDGRTEKNREACFQPIIPLFHLSIVPHFFYFKKLAADSQEKKKPSRGRDPGEGMFHAWKLLTDN
jgi:hypothetical protein